MEGNKDDALKCLNIGKESLESGDLVRARKFITKARRLDPTLRVDDLLSSLENDKEIPSSSSSAAQPDDVPKAMDNDPKLRNRSKPTRPSESSAVYTEEQITMVRRINSKKDYYDIMGLEKNCTVEDVRKAYRKLSLKVHPDKNNAPGAEDAYKPASTALHCLSNEESRKKYDITGSDEIIYERRTTTRRYANGGGYNNYYDEFDPDEIFRQFFFGGMQPPGTAHFRTFQFGAGARGDGGVHQGGSGLNVRTFIQLLPVLMLILFQFLPSSDPVFVLSRNYPYEYKFTTQRGVNYYVKSSNRFNTDFPVGSNSRQILEEKVDIEYQHTLAQYCRSEIQRQQWGFVKETPHCDMLRQFQSDSSVYSSESTSSA